MQGKGEIAATLPRLQPVGGVGGAIGKGAGRRSGLSAIGLLCGSVFGELRRVIGITDSTMSGVLLCI
jgi:hypothetical protein